MTVKSLRKQLAAAIAMTLVATVALGSSTYAWFVNNTQVTATDVSVQAVTSYSLMIKGNDAGDTYGTTKALSDHVILKPVSTIGTLATVAKTLSPESGTAPNVTPAVGNGDGTTVAIGDMEFFRSNTWNADGEVQTFIQVSKDSWEDYAGTNGDTRTATADTKDDDEVYFYYDKVFLKAGQASKIYVDSTNTGFSDNTSLTAFNSTSISDAATLHLLQTLRVAFVVRHTDGNPSTSDVFFYSLNDTSSDGTAATGTFAYNTTKKLSSVGDVDGYVNATSGENAVAAITASNLVSSRVPNIYAQAVAGNPAGFATPGNNAKEIASVDANEEVSVDIYMWMEGCDYDTTAANSAQFQTIIRNMQFGFCLGNAN